MTVFTRILNLVNEAVFDAVLGRYARVYVAHARAQHGVVHSNVLHCCRRIVVLVFKRASIVVVNRQVLHLVPALRTRMNSHRHLHFAGHLVRVLVGIQTVVKCVLPRRLLLLHLLLRFARNIVVMQEQFVADLFLATLLLRVHLEAHGLLWQFATELLLVGRRRVLLSQLNWLTH